MPSVEDYIHCPLDIVQTLLVEDDAVHSVKIKEYFSKRLSTESAMSWVPSLNYVPLHNLRSNTLVKFRCMVQDMYDPEYYMGVYETKNEMTGEIKLISGRYKDIAECQPGWQIQMKRNKMMDRQTLYCVPIPGESEWVKQAYSDASKANVAPSTSYTGSRSKRPLDGDTEISAVAMPGGFTDMDIDAEAPTAAEGVSDGKKPKTDSKPGGSSAAVPDLNFPLLGEKGPAVLVKVYENTDSYKVNDVVEFVGVLSNDPAMVLLEEGEESSSFVGADGDQMEGVEEQNAHSPPPSLVPRLHVLLSHHLKHHNPLLPMDLSATDSKPEVEKVLAAAQESRTHLLSVLEQIALGDKLAAEYLLCNLISNIYARQDVIPLGKFGLNLSACPRDTEFATHLYKVLRELVTKSHLLKMSLANMNTSKFCPKKDYKANRLTSGLLQLSEHTHLVVDETALENGQLDTQGVMNITALGNLIKWQKVEYDFNYHRQDFVSNIPVLVLSEGKSLLTCDSRVPLTPRCPVTDLAGVFSAVETYLTPALLTQLRSYLSIVRQLEYTISSDIQKMVEESFVCMRKDDPKNMSVEGFQSLLVIARLMTLSYGETTLTREIWEKARTMEQTRKQRLGSANPTTT